MPGTAVIGHVYASEPNPDGSNRPLSNVTVTVDGAVETLRTTTDVSGFFRLEPSPSGRFFVHIDGRTAADSAYPEGAYYPFIGKAWEAVPGRTDNPAAGTGEIFLPLIQADALQPVSAVEATTIGFSASVIAADPALADVAITVPPNALYSDNGTRGGRVGIAPVPPDRLPEPLPPGLELPLVITVQTDGPMNFDQPVPVCFPNLPHPRTGEVAPPPGAVRALISFNHDTGYWEVSGTMTVRPDGRLVCSDPGQGVRQPGWHGVSNGGPAGGPGGCPPFCEDSGDPCKKEAGATVTAIGDTLIAIAIAGGKAPPVLGCAAGSVLNQSRSVRDCVALDLNQPDCRTTVGNNLIGTGLGCIPVVGGIFSAGWTAKGLIDNAFAWYDCEQNQQGRQPAGPHSAGCRGLSTGSPEYAALARAIDLLQKQIISDAALCRARPASSSTSRVINRFLVTTVTGLRKPKALVRRPGVTEDAPMLAAAVRIDTVGERNVAPSALRVRVADPVEPVFPRHDIRRVGGFRGLRCDVVPLPFPDIVRPLQHASAGPVQGDLCAR